MCPFCPTLGAVRPKSIEVSAPTGYKTLASDAYFRRR
jgi:hypothetical protein